MASSSKVRQSRRQQLEAQRLAQAKKERRLRILLAGGGVVIVALVIGMVWLGMNGSTPKASDAPPNANKAQNGILLAPYVEGLPDLEEFISYSCSACKNASLVFSTVLEQAATTGKANVIIHPMTIHEEDTNASRAAVCADYQGKFYEFHKQLFLEQDTAFDGTSLRSTVPDLVGIWQEDLDEYLTCFDTEATARFVKASDNYSIKEKIGQTPTFRLDGEDVTQQVFNANTSSFDPDLLRELLGMQTD